MNVDSFMDVLHNTTRDAGMFSVPASVMPAGKALSIATSQLPTGAAGANLWHQMVKEEYERQESERDAPRSPARTHPPAGGGEDTPAEGPGRGGIPTLPDIQAVEAQLQKSVEETEEHIKQVRAEVIRLGTQEVALSAYLTRMRRALEAMKEPEYAREVPAQDSGDVHEDVRREEPEVRGDVARGAVPRPRRKKGGEAVPDSG